MTEISAFMDAAMFHAAYRLSNGLHRRGDWPYKGNYNSFDDEGLLLHLVHSLLFYDTLVVSNTCSTYLGDVHSEVKEVAEFVNRYCADEVVKTIKVETDLESSYQVRRIGTHLLRLIASSPHSRDLAEWEVPWAYRREDHHQFSNLKSVCEEQHIPMQFIPFAAYCLSGVVYSGIAYSRSRSDDEHMVYVAAPGRISALERILSHDELHSFAGANSAYEALASEVSLPKGGFEFQHLQVSLPPHELSPLSGDFAARPPMEALRYACELRSRSTFVEFRRSWPRRTLRGSAGATVGLPINQSVRGTIHGDVIMIVGRPNDTTIDSMDKAKQTAEGVNVGGGLKQQSSTPNTEQTVRDADVAKNLEQRIDEQGTGLQVGGAKAYGRLAVILLGVIVVVYIIVQALR